MSSIIFFRQKELERINCIAVAGLEQKDRVGWRALSHPAFQSIEIEICDRLSPEGRLSSSRQTVITCSKLISAQALSQVITFLYTGRIRTKIINMAAVKQVRHRLDLLAAYSAVLQAAEFLELTDLTLYLNNISNKEHYLNMDLEQANLLVS